MVRSRLAPCTVYIILSRRTIQGIGFTSLEVWRQIFRARSARLVPCIYPIKDIDRRMRMLAKTLNQWPKPKHVSGYGRRKRTPDLQAIADACCMLSRKIWRHAQGARVLRIDLITNMMSRAVVDWLTLAKTNSRSTSTRAANSMRKIMLMFWVWG